MTALATQPAGGVTPVRPSARDAQPRTRWRTSLVEAFHAYQANRVRRLVANDPLTAMLGRH